MEVALSNGLNISWTRLFSFFAKMFPLLDDFSKWNIPKECWKSIKKIGKKWRKALFNLRSTHFSHWFLVAKTRFQILGPLLYEWCIRANTITRSRLSNFEFFIQIGQWKKWWKMWYFFLTYIIKIQISYY